MEAITLGVEGRRDRREPSQGPCGEGNTRQFRDRDFAACGLIYWRLSCRRKVIDVGYPSGVPSVRSRNHNWGYAELLINQRPPSGTSMCREHAELAVLTPPSGIGAMAATPAERALADNLSCRDPASPCADVAVSSSSLTALAGPAHDHPLLRFSRSAGPARASPARPRGLGRPEPARSQPEQGLIRRYPYSIKHTAITSSSSFRMARLADAVAVLGQPVKRESKER